MFVGLAQPNGNSHATPDRGTHRRTNSSAGSGAHPDKRPYTDTRSRQQVV